MISCEVQRSKTFNMRKLAQIGHSSCHFANKLKESARFTHFNLQFQQISRVYSQDRTSEEGRLIRR